MHSISDLTTFARKTKGDVPPQLVGASTTVVGNKMYLYGGRLVSLRRMVSDLYVFDLESYIWEKIEPTADEDVPGARYFHSADSWNNKLIVFGGMGYTMTPEGAEELCVLNDVRFFDLTTRRWIPTASSTTQATLPPDTPSLIPRERYAHLSSVTDDRLFIIGGQDMSNVWLDDIHVYDLRRAVWVQRRDYPRHCGTYRSVAVSSKARVRSPQDEVRGDAGLLGPPGSRFKVDGVPPSSPSRLISEELTHLSYSAAPTPEYPNDIFLYSNYNFTDVRRELEVMSPTPEDFSITDRSESMTGASLPPGLRFPTGAVLGNHLIIAGTYLAHSYQSFSVWALDLVSMTWSRIDAGTALTTGSWSRGCLWEDGAKFLIFGNRNGNLVEDYNRRLLSWDHVAYIDLEAFGIYQPPRLALELHAQELGLAALEEQVLADFEVVCDDGRKIKCSRKALEDRWPWFKQQRKVYLAAAARALETLPASTSPDEPLPIRRPIVPEGISEIQQDALEPRPDPRLTPRSFHLSEPYAITMALLQYIYSLALITPLQHAPPVLSALLLLSTTYKMPHLESLVKHAMHRALSPSSSVGVYEVATLCDCQSLQIRALKVVMASSRRPSQQPSRSRSDRTDDESGGGGDKNGGPPPHHARPRGMSDAPRPQYAGTDGYNSSRAMNGMQSDNAGAGFGQGRANVPISPTRGVHRSRAMTSPRRGARPHTSQGTPERTHIAVTQYAPRKGSLPETSFTSLAPSLSPTSTVCHSRMNSLTIDTETEAVRREYRFNARLASASAAASANNSEAEAEITERADKIVRRWSTKLSFDDYEIVSSIPSTPADSAATTDVDTDTEDSGKAEKVSVSSPRTPQRSAIRPTVSSPGLMTNTTPTSTPTTSWGSASSFSSQFRAPYQRKVSVGESSFMSTSSMASSNWTANRKRAGSDATSSFDGYGPMTPPSSMSLASVNGSFTSPMTPTSLHRIDEFNGIINASRPPTPRLSSMGSMPDLRKRHRQGLDMRLMDDGDSMRSDSVMGQFPMPPMTFGGLLQPPPPSPKYASSAISTAPSAISATMNTTTSTSAVDVLRPRAMTLISSFTVQGEEKMRMKMEKKERKAVEKEEKRRRKEMKKFQQHQMMEMSPGRGEEAERRRPYLAALGL